VEFNKCYACFHDLPTEGAVCPHCGYDNREKPAMQPSFALRCGTILAGRYFLGKMIDQSGSEISYAAYDLVRECRVCVREFYIYRMASRAASDSRKVIWNAQYADACSRARQSYVDRTVTAKKLQSMDHIANITDVFAENNTVYCVSDYYEGVSLKYDMRARTRPLDEKRCAELFLPLAEELEKVHAAGMLHLEINPKNLLVTPEGKLVLLNLAAAEKPEAQADQADVITRMDSFFPLEQLVAGSVPGPWTDVYGLCGVMYYCLTGKYPAASPARLCGQELECDRLSSEMKGILEKGLALQTQDRFQTMAELAAQIRSFGAAPAVEKTDAVTEKKLSDAEKKALRTGGASTATEKTDAVTDKTLLDAQWKTMLGQSYRTPKEPVSREDIAALNTAERRAASPGQSRDAASAEKGGEKIKEPERKKSSLRAKLLGAAAAVLTFVLLVWGFNAILGGKTKAVTSTAAPAPAATAEPAAAPAPTATPKPAATPVPTASAADRQAEAKAKAREIEEQIAALGEISLDSEPKVRSARADYDALSADAKMSVSNLSVLTEAEAALQKLLDEQALTEIRHLYSSGDYEGTIEYAETYYAGRDLTTLSDDFFDYVVWAYAQRAEQYKYESAYEMAQKLLEKCVSLYGDTAFGSKARESLDELNRKIRSNEPYNGQVLRATANSGYCELEIRNGADAALVKLESTTEPDTYYIEFYVRENETVKLQVRDGSYLLKYASGKTWYSEKELFGSDTYYAKADTIQEFTTTYSGDYVQYTTIEITLYKVRNGNLSTSSISAEDF